jgi:hypothetical protein
MQSRILEGIFNLFTKDMNLRLSKRLLRYMGLSRPYAGPPSQDQDRMNLIVIQRWFLAIVKRCNFSNERAFSEQSATRLLGAHANRSVLESFNHEIFPL